MYCISMGNNGVQETAGAATAAFVIPTSNGGLSAKKVAIRVVTVTETMYVRPGAAGVAVTVENGLPVSKENPVILNVSGCSHLAAMRAGAVDVVFNITPLEN